MDLWVAGIALLIIATGILVLILCREKIHKGLRIAVVCVLGVLFAAVLGYIALTFLFLNSLDSPPLDVPTASGKVLSEKQAIIEQYIPFQPGDTLYIDKCELTYIYDTKGFYQPVYEFSGYINNRENLWVARIPALC